MSLSLTLRDEVRRLWVEGQKCFFILGCHLKDIRDKKLYKEINSTFKEFLQGEDIPESTAYQLIRIVETFSLTVETAKTFPLSWKKAQLLTPVVKKSPKKKNSLIAFAESHTTKELQEELKVERGQVVDVKTLTLSGGEGEIELLTKGLEKISSVTGKTTIDVVIDLVKKELKSRKVEIRHQATEVGMKSREFSDLFCSKYQEHLGTKYMYRGVVDAQLCKKIVQTFTLEELQKGLTQFFTTKGKDKWWNGYTLGVFFSVVNDMVSRSKKIDKPSKYSGMKKVYDEKTGMFKYV